MDSSNNFELPVEFTKVAKFFVKPYKCSLNKIHIYMTEKEIAVIFSVGFHLTCQFLTILNFFDIIILSMKVDVTK